MKKMQVLLIALSLLVGTGTTLAYGPINVPTDPASSLEISELLKNPEFTIENDCQATVEFVMNKHHEMVILTVEAEDNTFEEFLRNRLNYQLLETPLEIGKTYTVPIKLVAIK
jgi:hypothetical protein